MIRGGFRGPKDQISRVTKALLDFECLRGLSSSSLESARSLSSRTDSVVDRGQKDVEVFSNKLGLGTKGLR